MIIFVEDKKPLFEVVQAAGKREYSALLAQMKQNPDLSKTLNTSLGKMPKYRYLTDDPILKGASLLQIIKGTMERSGYETFFIKTPKGAHIGFLALTIDDENSSLSVQDVKVFSFGLENSDDENQIYKDLPAFLDTCLSKYGKVSWTAMEGNKANRAYAIYTKRKKGTIEKNGKYIRYTCIKQ